MTTKLDLPQARSAIMTAMHSGNLDAARDLASKARDAFPNDARLAQLSGSIALKTNDPARAAEFFEAAVRLEPGSLAFVLDHTIALQRLGRHADVLSNLARYEAQGRFDIRYANTMAASYREMRNLAEAAFWYDHALSLDNRNRLALMGRSRVALERCEETALAFTDRALAVNPGDANLWLGKANALDMAGDHDGALLVARQIVEQAPGLIDGLSLLAQLRLARGDEDFASHYNDAASKQPQNPNIPLAHCSTLEGAGQSAQAADVASRARIAFPDISHFALLEALHRGSAGQWSEADAIFRTLEDTSAQRHLHEARHRLRGNAPDQAEALLEKVLAKQPWDIAAWALRGIAWRLLDDPRREWLHEQSGLVNFLPLAGESDLLERVIDHLHDLHARSPFPLGQSLRGGTQTRANLFDYASPVLGELAHAIKATLEEYRAGLPDHDATHPLLRHRASDWRFDGSWSVRLTGGSDHHAAHIHPAGIISSALYLVVPESAQEQGGGGALEVGRPATNLDLDLPPLATLQPRPGHLALFPSTLYHGTTPFKGEERMTVAFDVVV
ncbi:MAG: putative 2OG-Fe(II) oxygenase [Pseudomonadota bacterium]